MSRLVYTKLEHKEDKLELHREIIRVLNHIKPIDVPRYVIDQQRQHIINNNGYNHILIEGMINDQEVESGAFIYRNIRRRKVGQDVRCFELQCMVRFCRCTSSSILEDAERYILEHESKGEDIRIISRPLEYNNKPIFKLVNYYDVHDYKLVLGQIHSMGQGEEEAKQQYRDIDTIMYSTDFSYIVPVNYYSAVCRSYMTKVLPYTR